MMKLAVGGLLLCLCVPSCDAFAWPDCGDVDVNATGPFGDMQQFNVTHNGTIIFVLHPPLPGKGPYPVIVYSHGGTGEYAMYEYAIRRYVSHGFVVIFPHVKDPKKDTSPFTMDPMGGYTIKGVYYAWSANADASSPLHNMLDVQNIVLAGHSMGGSGTIMAAMKLPAGAAKVAVAQHPLICGPFGPPPCLAPSDNPLICGTWMPSDFKIASTKMPMFMTSATNDGAFWPAPHTAEHELGCFHKSTDSSDSKSSTAFASFSAAVCEDDGKGGRYDRKWSNGGHDCPMKHPSVETQWVLAAAKLYAQLGGNANSKCHAMLWGAGAGSLQMDPDVDKYVINPPMGATTAVVV